MKMRDKLKVSTKLCKVSGVAVAGLVVSGHEVMAQTVSSFSQDSSTIQQNIQAAGGDMYYVAMLAGVGIFLKAIFGAHRDHQQQQPIGKHLATGLFGLALILGPAIIEMSSGSVMSGSSAQSALQSVGFGTTQ
jgi:hypothetical protein